MSASSRSLATQEAVLGALKGKKSDLKGIGFQVALLGALLVALLLLLILLTDVVRKGFSVFADRGVADFVTAPLNTFTPATAGVWQGVMGSLLTLIFVVVVAIPIGIAAAVYLEEYAADTRWNRFINVNIRNLAGVPSIVYGLLGLAVFVELLGGLTGGTTVIAAGLTLAVLVLPLIIITSAEALRAVPASIREAGYGVGATRWEVIRSHVLPSAAPGILTGTILSLARAIGETAPVLMVGAITGYLSTGTQGFWEQLRGPFTTLPTLIFRYATLPSDGFRSVTGAAIMVLLAVILSASAIAIFLRNRFERKW